MQALLKPLLELAEYEDIVKKKKEAPGVLMLTGCVNSQKTHMMYALSDGCCYKVIACSSEAKAKQIYEEYRFLDAAISFYPAKKRMKNTVSWTKMYFCIRQRIYCFTRQIFVVKSWSVSECR